MMFVHVMRMNTWIRYNVNGIGVTAIFTMDAPSPQHVVNVVENIRRKRVSNNISRVLIASGTIYNIRLI